MGKDTRDARESSPQPGRKLRGGKVTGRRETGRKETGGKTTGAKERGVGETGGKEKGVGETGGKEKGVGETGGKTTGVKEREVGEKRAKEWEVGETGAKETGGKETGGKGSGQNGMEGIERKSYSAALIEGVRKRARVFVGDSIVRKTDRVLNKGDDVVVCLPGAKIEAITERVKNIVGSGKGGSVLVHVGTNNVEREGTTAIVRKYRQLVRTLKQTRVEQVILSGILPVMGRRGHKYRNCRGMAINMLVQKLCREEEVGFVDLWGSFVGRADMYMIDIIYLDFQKAFDKVPHQRLLLKLKAHGIGDSIIDWIEQWLTDRRQRVVVDGEVSNWKSVLSGVPQGSVLGPILFLIYINDLDDSITSNVLKFADDTKLFRKVNTDGDKQHLQNDLDRLVKWPEKWQMLFNFGKCKCLHTGHRNLNVNYKMGDTVLGTTVKEKDLGVTISADMKVSEQCGIAASKGNQILGLIRRNITYKGKKLIIPLYKAIVRPYLDYCIQAWRPYRKKDIDTLERIQRRATEIRQSKRSYEQKLACNIKNDSKSCYAYVRSKQNVQDKVGPLEDSAGNIISQGFLMAEDLNGYFSLVFTKKDISSLPVADAKFQGAKSDYLGPLVVTPELVAKKIKAMKDNKSPGVDGIPPKLLMETVEQISIPLARVFNLSLKEGVVPFEWKEANIIPLFKKGSRNKSENYRPVSLTSVIWG